MATMDQYTWLIAIISIAFCFSCFGNGGNDVANAYATSVAAQTLRMWQAGILAMVTEFVGAVALGAGVTDTIKNKIIDIGRFNDNPATLILTMTCAEIGSAAWLNIANRIGFPVSTTHTIVGALVGAGIAAGADVTWRWTKGSVSQIAASWAIAPLLSAAMASVIFLILKFSVLERKESFKWAMRLIPFYLAFTGGVLALFIVIEIPNAPSLEEFGPGKAAGIILGTFFGVLALAYVFFMPYFHRRLVLNDARIRVWHLPLGPLLYRRDPPIYWPGNGGCPEGAVTKDHYRNARLAEVAPGDEKEKEKEKAKKPDHAPAVVPEPATGDAPALERGDGVPQAQPIQRKRHLEPKERFLGPTKHLPIYSPARLWSWAKYLFLQGVTRDVTSHNSARLEKTHARATRYDNKVEHLWTYAQVASAMMMSIAHGSNDVANAVGPWAAAYSTWKAGVVETNAPTPIWILVVAGFLLGFGFWVVGWRIVATLGNKITQMSPTRGFSIELGAAITILLASRLSLPVSTTHCLTGATMGVSLMNFTLGATNWPQLLWIFFGWVLTLPVAGLMSGLLTVMALNTPQF
jgi:sodium-dependent phosphate transporter